MAEAYLSIEDISARMHISIGTARNRLSRGEPMPPSIKIGRRRLFPESLFHDWMMRFLQSNEPDFFQAKGLLKRK